MQAFVFNTYGCIDNLARICIFENSLKKPDGKPFPNGWIGLGKKNKAVRQQLSQPFRNLLSEYNGWLEYLSDYRHALAHRIPLYIPPNAVSKKQELEYSKLEKEIHQIDRNMFKNYRNHAVFWSLSSEKKKLENDQMKLTHFRPVMMHSFNEGVQDIVFHAQILADFATVEKLGEQVLIEIS